MLKIKKQSKEKKSAEAAVDIFRKNLGPFVIDPEKTRTPIIFTDAKESDNPIIFANASFLTFTAYSREEVLGKSCKVLMADGTDPEAMTQLAAAFEANSDADPEIRCRRKDGTEFWATVFVNPVVDDRGDVVQHFVSFADISKLKQAQSQANMLIDEYDHRVNNMLSTVHLTVMQALRKYSNVEVIRDAIEARIFALARRQSVDS